MNIKGLLLSLYIILLSSGLRAGPLSGLPETPSEEIDKNHDPIEETQAEPIQEKNLGEKTSHLDESSSKSLMVFSERPEIPLRKVVFKVPKEVGGQVLQMPFLFENKRLLRQEIYKKELESYLRERDYFGYPKRLFSLPSEFVLYNGQAWVEEKIRDYLISDLHRQHQVSAEKFRVVFKNIDFTKVCSFCFSDPQEVRIEFLQKKPSRRLLSFELYKQGASTDSSKSKFYGHSKFKILSKIAVTRKTLSSNHPIDEKTISFQWRELPAQGTPIFSLEPLENMKIKVPRSAGSYLLVRHIDERSLVKFGDVVPLYISSGNVKIRAKGKALANGSLGEIIKIRNLNTRKTLKGRVEKDASVKVSL
jgi:flagella basal body P-ring formation protein FlgA